jgi:hypothetical protein
MTKNHFGRREPDRRYKLVIILCAGVMSALAAGIYAVTKSAEFGWLPLIVFPALVFMLIRPNPQYRAVTSVVEMSRAERPDFTKRAKHRVFAFVDSVDLANIQAVRYGQCLHADDLTAVHFVLDPALAPWLQDYWDRFEPDTKLQMVACPDRRLSLAAHDLLRHALDNEEDTRVTVLLARRTYAPLVGRLLHDRTADKLARVISRIPGATAQIVVYDVKARIAHATRAQRESAAERAKGLKVPRTPESAPQFSASPSSASHEPGNGNRSPRQRRRRSPLRRDRNPVSRRTSPK